MPLGFAGCSPAYNTTLINNTAQPLVIEAVQKPGVLHPALDIPNHDPTACTTRASSYATRQICRLAPEQTCYLGSATTFLAAAPLDGDTIIVRTSDGQVRRFTASSVDDFVTDTTTGRLGVEGQPYVTYTIRIK
jgi:hypothetical protein